MSIIFINRVAIQPTALDDMSGFHTKYAKTERQNYTNVLAKATKTHCRPKIFSVIVVAFKKARVPV